MWENGTHLDCVAGLLNHPLQDHNDLIPSHIISSLDHRWWFSHRSFSSFFMYHDTNMSIFLSFWKLWFRKYFPPLFQEVSRAHPIERALLINLVHEGGGPDEEDLILLALRIGANLGWSSLSKSGMWSCTDQRFFARKVYIQSGRANSTESGIRALEGLVSWTYHRQSVLSAAQGEVPTFSPAETSGQEKNCTCWKLERQMPEQENTNEKQMPLLSREDIPSSYQIPRIQHF